MAAKESPAVPGFAHQLDFMGHPRSQQQQQPPPSPPFEFSKHGFCSPPPTSSSPPSFLALPHQQHPGLSPVAMSLRTRESSALSLKYIFDQIQQHPNGRGGDAGDLCQKQDEGADTAMHQSASSTTLTTTGAVAAGGGALRNQSNRDVRKRLPELDLSFRQHIDFPPQTGFGSPISTPSTIQQQQQSVHSLPIGTLFNSHPPQWLPPSSSSLPGSGYCPQVAMVSRAGASSKQPIAQLTIFYSGTVNVYDDVPADKAQAIMLLAGTGGTGNSWSSSIMRSTPSVEKERCTLPTATNSSPSAPVLPPPSAPSPNVTAGGVPLSLAAKPPVVPQSPAAPTQSSTSTLTVPTIEQPKPQISIKRPHAGIELPHARKASLARFLEKRKDRVQVKPVTEVKGDIATQEPSSPNHKDKDVEKDCMDCDNSHGNSDTSAKKQCVSTSFSAAPTQVHNPTTTPPLQYQKLPIERRFMGSK